MVVPSGECLRGEGRYGVFATWKLCDPYLRAIEVSFSRWGAIQIYVPFACLLVDDVTARSNVVKKLSKSDAKHILSASSSSDTSSVSSSSSDDEDESSASSESEEKKPQSGLCYVYTCSFILFTCH